jgi:hypothetical protein
VTVSRGRNGEVECLSCQIMYAASVMFVGCRLPVSFVVKGLKELMTGSGTGALAIVGGVEDRQHKQYREQTAAREAAAYPQCRALYLMAL